VCVFLCVCVCVCDTSLLKHTPSSWQLMSRAHSYMPPYDVALLLWWRSRNLATNQRRGITLFYQPLLYQSNIQVEKGEFFFKRAHPNTISKKAWLAFQIPIKGKSSNQDLVYFRPCSSRRANRSPKSEARPAVHMHVRSYKNTQLHLQTHLCDQADTPRRADMRQFSEHLFMSCILRYHWALGIHPPQFTRAFLSVVNVGPSVTMDTTSRTGHWPPLYFQVFVIFIDC